MSAWYKPSKVREKYGLDRNGFRRAIREGRLEVFHAASGQRLFRQRGTGHDGPPVADWKTPKEAALELGVSRLTVLQWARDGTLESKQGHPVSFDKLVRLAQKELPTPPLTPPSAHVTTGPKRYLYARVDDVEKADELREQINQLKEAVRGSVADYTICCDMAHETDFARPQLGALLNCVLAGDCAEIVVTRSDRLASVGYELIERMCHATGTELRILHQPWSAEETDELRYACAIYDDNAWAAIAAHLPGRTAEDCKCHYAATRAADAAGRREGRWSAEEDAALTRSVQRLGADDWVRVARMVPGRNNAQCYQRWRISLKGWAPADDKALLEAYATFGRQWTLIARCVQGNRGEAECMERWEALQQM